MMALGDEWQQGCVECRRVAHVRGVVSLWNHRRASLLGRTDQELGVGKRDRAVVLAPDGQEGVVMVARRSRCARIATGATATNPATRSGWLLTKGQAERCALR